MFAERKIKTTQKTLKKEYVYTWIIYELADRTRT